MSANSGVSANTVTGNFVPFVVYGGGASDGYPENWCFGFVLSDSGLLANLHCVQVCFSFSNDKKWSRRYNEGQWTSWVEI